MNWSKGFFRVWIIFSTLWIGGFAVITYQSEPYFPHATISISQYGSINMFSDGGIEEAQLNELKSRGQNKSYSIVGYPEFRFFIPTSLAATNDAEDKAIDALAEYAKVYRSETLATHQSYLFWLFINAGLGIPLTLLGIGSALAWALRGFKRPTT